MGRSDPCRPDRMFQHGKGGICRHARTQMGPHRKHWLGQRSGRSNRSGELRGREIRHPWLYQIACRRGCALWRDRQCNRAGLYRHRNALDDPGKCDGKDCRKNRKQQGNDEPDFHISLSFWINKG